ncbi:hypothetical protein ACFQ60_39010 [Streptomyces zhihengii]
MQSARRRLVPGLALGLLIGLLPLGAAAGSGPVSRPPSARCRPPSSAPATVPAAPSRPGGCG